MRIFCLCAGVSALALLAGSADASTVSYSYDALGRLVAASGSDGSSVSYAYDPTGDRTSVQVVAGGNHSPVALDDHVTTPLNKSVSFDPTANDSDPDGGALSVTNKSNGTNGIVSILGPNTVKYNPVTGFSGSDQFSYTVSDGNKAATANVMVWVSGGNTQPTTTPDSITTPINTPATINPLPNDHDADGDALTVTGIAVAPQHGTAAYTSNSVSYAPGANYKGFDSFNYAISDGHGGTAAGVVSVQVTDPYQPPVAVADTLDISVFHASGTSVVPSGIVNVLANDHYTAGITPTILVVTQPARGVASIQSDNSIKYQYNTSVPLNRHDTDSFTYTISDGQNQSATATVTVTIDVEVSGGGS